MAEIPEPSSTEDATTTGGSAPTSTDGAVNEAPSAAESTTTPAHVSKSEQAQIDREVAETATALLQRADWSSTCLTAVVEALEAIREAQLEPEPDVPALLATLLEDVLVDRCTCGHQFNFGEAFDTPRLAITA